MARHYVQAAAVVCLLFVVGLVIDQVGARWLIGQYGSLSCRNLFRLLAIVVFPVLFLVIACRNYGSILPVANLMRQSSIGVAFGLSGVLSVTALLYHRTWELFEREHIVASAEISPGEAGQLLEDMIVGAVVDGEGRLWSVEWKWSNNWRGSLHREDPPNAPQFSRIDEGSDWARVVSSDWYHGYGYAALKSDGTFWVVAGPLYERFRKRRRYAATMEELPAQLTERTPGFRWRDVEGGYRSWWGVRDDGTLWEWGWRALSRRNGEATKYGYIREPRQIGDASDWKQVERFMALKRDGSVWRWQWRRDDDKKTLELTGIPELEGIPVTSIAQASYSVFRGADGLTYTRGSRTDSPAGSYSVAVPGRERLYRLSDDIDWAQPSGPYLKHQDGSLWFYYDQDERVPLGKVRRRMDQSLAWLAFREGRGGRCVGLKQDGSLWGWYREGNRGNKTFYEAEGLTIDPRRLIPRRFRPWKIGELDLERWR